MEPELLRETEHWIVFNKPAGWLTIPGRLTDVPVLSDYAQNRFGRLWIVHRLDRETSGVVLLARSADAHRRANAWFQDHKVKKAYDALAEGAPPAPVLRLNEPVNGSPSTTQILVAERFGSCFLARAHPLTGRRHQIRIHLSGAGYPILGDLIYGGKKELGGLAIERTALHARRLELPSGEVFEAPWPADFEGWVTKLRKETAR